MFKGQGDLLGWDQGTEVGVLGDKIRNVTGSQILYDRSSPRSQCPGHTQGQLDLSFRVGGWASLFSGVLECVHGAVEALVPIIW